MSKDNFASAEHALLTGMMLGEFMRYGVDAGPGIDADGDYTDVLTIGIEMGVKPISIRVRVLPPEEST